MSLMVVFIVGMLGYRRWIDRYQQSRPRYAAERALAALQAKDLAAVRREVVLLERERPAGSTGMADRQVSNIWDGPVLRNRFQICERLAAGLLAAGLADEAERVAWKAQFEYHLGGRPVEDIISWEVMHAIKVARGDWAACFEIERILAAHGASRLRLPGDIENADYPAVSPLSRYAARMLPDKIIKGLYFQAMAMTDGDRERARLLLADVDDETSSPAVRRGLQRELHRTLIDAGQSGAAHELLAKILGVHTTELAHWADPSASLSAQYPVRRNPALLDMLWRDQSSTGTAGLLFFLQTFSADSRVTVLSLSEMKKLENGFYDPALKLDRLPEGYVFFYQNLAGRLDIAPSRPVKKIFIAYEGSQALGLYPIVLLRVDDGPWHPIYCDGAGPGLSGYQCDLSAGQHTLDIAYLNDGGFKMKQVNEDRLLKLYRVALVDNDSPGRAHEN